MGVTENQMCLMHYHKLYLKCTKMSTDVYPATVP